MSPPDRQDRDTFEYTRQMAENMRQLIDDRTRELADTIERRHQTQMDKIAADHLHRKANAETAARMIGEHELALHPTHGWVVKDIAQLREDLEDAVSQRDGRKGWVTIALAATSSTQTWIMRAIIVALLSFTASIVLQLIGDT